MDNWNWTVGWVVGPFGLAGELKVKFETDFPERFNTLKQVCLRPLKGAPLLATIQSVRIHKGQLLLKVEGIGSIDQVQPWRGAAVQIPREEAIELPQDSYYAADLVGAVVVTRDGRELGKLEKILPYPAQDLFQIGDILIPAVKEFILSVDVAGRRIVVDPPSGLLPEEQPGRAD